jgi:DNA invertase Pin-like site-specific DNA recombinase
VTDGRKTNKPPKRERALTDECGGAIDEMIAMTMQRKEIARRIGVHHRTVYSAAKRQGAYAGVPKINAEVKGDTK